MDPVGLLLFLAGAALLVRNSVVAGQWAARRGKVKRPFTAKTSVVNHLFVLTSGIVYLLSFQRCGLRYIWLLLGAASLFSSIVGLVSIPFVYKTSVAEAYNKPSKGMKGYFVGRSAFGLLASTVLLCLWVYSWRHLVSQQ